MWQSGLSWVAQYFRLLGEQGAERHREKGSRAEGEPHVPSLAELQDGQVYRTPEGLQLLARRTPEGWCLLPYPTALTFGQHSEFFLIDGSGRVFAGVVGSERLEPAGWDVQDLTITQEAEES